MRSFSCFVALSLTVFLPALSIASPRIFPRAHADWTACPARPADLPKWPLVAVSAVIFEDDATGLIQLERRLAGLDSVSLFTTRPQVDECEDFIGGRLPICGWVFLVAPVSSGLGGSTLGTRELAQLVQEVGAAKPLHGLTVEECK